MTRKSVTLLLSFLLVPVLLHARVEGHFDRTLSVSGSVHLDLTTGSGDITIKSGQLEPGGRSRNNPQQQQLVFQ